jgi:hypothetical protein
VKKNTSLPAAAYQKLVQSMKAVRGFSGQSVVSPRGIALKSSYNVPSGLPRRSRQIVQSLQRQMKQLTAQLPARPVGVGARWRVDIPIQGPPLRMVSRLTYKLRALSRRTADVGVQVSGSAPPQKMQFPNLPAGAAARLKSLTSGGTGKMRLHFRQPKATGRLKITQSMETTFQIMGRTRDMKMNMQMIVRMR